MASDYREVVPSILVAKAAVATFAIAPFLLGGYIDKLDLSPALASRLLAVEILSLALSNATGYLWLRRVDHRSLAQRLLLTSMLLNISCVFGNNYELLLVQRAIIGVVEGALLTVGFGLLGVSRNPERNFGWYFAISLTVSAVNVRILPLFLEAGGVPGLFVNLTLYAAIAFVGTFWLPRSVTSEAGESAPIGATTSSAAEVASTAVIPLALLLCANFIYFVGQGGVWSFLERLGVQRQLPLDDIAAALSASLISGVAGGFFASGLQLRIGRLKPLIAAVLCSMTALVILWKAPSPSEFILAACLFNFGNNLGHPYTLGLTSRLDRSGRLTVLAGALHTGGQAAGPFVVGLLVAPLDFTAALWVGLVAFAVTPVMILPAALTVR